MSVSVPFSLASGLLVSEGRMTTVVTPFRGGGAISSRWGTRCAYIQLHHWSLGWTVGLRVVVQELPVVPLQNPS